MAIYKCKMCGGDLDVAEDVKVVECEYCGTSQTVPSGDDEKKARLFNRANRLRMGSEFDKAASIYESIIAEYPEEAEAYWGLCLSNYGIEYVDDPATAKKIPTCHRTAFESIFKDENFEMALEYADPVARGLYRQEAKEIDRLQKAILEIAQNAQPYDIFICYKETDASGKRTKDSVRGQEIYQELTKQGYKVFFSRITLEDKLGTDYEPYIFAALNSAKIMLAVGTSYENYNAVWVKNEWGRFLKLMEHDSEKKLIPCYEDLDAYDIPEEFSRLQGQDMSKLGFMQDLLRGINKIIRGSATVQATPTASVDSDSIAPLMERAFMFCEDKEWDSADEYFERALDKDPKNAQAYLGKLMVDCRLPRKEALGERNESFENNKNYLKVCRFGDEELVGELNGYIRQIEERLENNRKNGVYEDALKEMHRDTLEGFKDALKLFQSISGHSDADTKAEACRKIIEQIYAERERIAEEKRIQAGEVQDKIQKLKKEKELLEKELTDLKGLFTGNRRKELEARINKIKQQIIKIELDACIDHVNH